MASVTKRGNTYTIRVSLGYDGRGRQLRQSMTWKPPEGMTEKQVKKELERQKVEFEQRCMQGQYMDGTVKLSDFFQRWFNDYAKKQLKARTAAEYLRLFSRIDEALGHLRLDKIQPRHLIMFYNNLAETGVRKDFKFKPRSDFAEHMNKNRLTVLKLAELADVSAATVGSCRKGLNVSAKTAEKITAALNGVNLFSPVDENKTLSSTSVAKYHTLLSSVLSTAVNWQIITSNPCDRVKPPKKQRREAEYMDDIQTAELIKCLNSEPLQYKTIITVLLYSGMRRGELCGLEWSDVDFKNSLISISRASLYLPGHGIFDDTPKNTTSARAMKMPPVVIELLRQHRKEQTEERLKLGDRWTDTGKIFTQHNGKPIHPDTVSAWFVKFLERHGLPHIPLHGLRHTNASLMIANGMNIRTVSKRLGHSNTSTTVNIYTHAIQSADERAAQILDIILTPKAVPGKE